MTGSQFITYVTGRSEASTMLALAGFLLGGTNLACRDQGPGPNGVRTRWHVAQVGSAPGRPAFAGGSVFFATGDARVVARDVRTGAARWSASIGSGPATAATLVASAGTVVVPVLFETVGLDVATGRRLWTFTAPPDTIDGRNRTAPGGAMQHKTPAADATTAYIPAWGASVSAVDLRTGAVRWVWQPGRMVSDTAAGLFRSGAEGVTVAGDTVFATVWHFRDRRGVYSSDPILVAISARTGAELWRVVLPHFTSGLSVLGAPVVNGSLVIFGGPGGNTFAIDRTTRAVVWEFEADSVQNGTVIGPALHDGVVYVDSGDEHLVALRATDGRLLWRTHFGGLIDEGLLVTDRYVYAPRGGEIFIFDRRTGRIVRKLNQPGRTYDSFIASAPAEQNGRIFVNVKEAAWSFDEP